MNARIWAISVIDEKTINVIYIAKFLGAICLKTAHDQLIFAVK